MLDPVSATDFTANSQADGLGTDYTSLSSVAATYQANSVLLELSTLAPTSVFFTLLQCRGTGVYDQADTVLEAVADDTDGQPENILTLDLSYQTDVALALEEAQFQIHISSQGHRRAKTVTVYPTDVDSDIVARSYAVRDISDKITITELVNALVATEAYYINGIAGEITPDGECRLTYTLEIADATQYWVLEQAGKSELGLTTTLAFGLVIGHADLAHGDTHADSAHTDSAHSDTSHSDHAHGDSAGHGDTAHADSHSDTAHSDTAHSDDAHVDSHSDVAHVDSHGDDEPLVFHGDHDDASESGLLMFPPDGHEDSVEFGHTDTHADTSHGDTHTDTSHSDVSHSDISHVDTHTDVAHSDVAHGDAAHLDDASHTDTAHSDVAHTDVAHGDADHGDGHSDSPHGDAN